MCIRDRGITTPTGNEGRIYYDTTSSKFKCSENGGAYIDCFNSGSGGGTITGSGTATQLAFWSGTNSLSSSPNLYWDNINNRLGIGTLTPSAQLTQKSTTAMESATIGPDLLDQAGWTSVDWVGSNSDFIHNIGNTTPLTNSISAVPGKEYLIDFYDDSTAGSFDISFGGVCQVPLN